MISKLWSFVKTAISSINLTYICHIINKILNLFIDFKKEEKEKKYNEQITQTNNEIEDACNSGTLSDLMNATKNSGRIKK